MVFGKRTPRLGVILIRLQKPRNVVLAFYILFFASKKIPTGEPIGIFFILT